MENIIIKTPVGEHSIEELQAILAYANHTVNKQLAYALIDKIVEQAQEIERLKESIKTRDNEIETLEYELRERGM